jgi:esterase
MSDFIAHHEWVGAPSDARHLGLFIHGALGSGQNFRSFAKRLVALCPGHAFALIDLRGHGQSHGAQGPHTIAAAALDVERVARVALEATPQSRLACVIGHSLGGKVALEFARNAALVAPQVWALDANPGVQDPNAAHQIKAVLDAVRAIPEPIAARQDVVAALLARGLSNGLAQWMTTNLRREGDVFRWVFDFDVILALLADYFELDCWPVLAAPKPGTELHLVIAEASNRWTPQMRAKAAAAEQQGGATVHLLPNSGHWVHVCLLYTSPSPRD